MRRPSSLLFAVATASLLLAASSLPTMAGTRTVLQGSRPVWAKATRRVAAADGSQIVGFRVYLPWRNNAEAAAYATAVSTKGNSKSGKFLTPGEFRKLYAPTKTATDAVTQWLVTSGFKIGHVPDNRHYIEAIGSLNKAAAAFKTTFSIYRYSGQRLRSNDTLLSVPAGLPAIDAVMGLDESNDLVHSNALPPAGFRNAPPCSSYWNQKDTSNTPTLDGTVIPAPTYPWAPCGYTPSQLQGAYGVAGAIAAGNDGRGVTVAVIDAYASRYAASDLRTYSQAHGLPTNFSLKEVVAPGTYNRAQNKVHDPEGWAGEETLDLEAVHTMAPGASLVYVGAPNNRGDLDAALNHVVDKHLADIVTNSYGYSSEALPPGYIKPYNSTFIQAAIEGITVLFSSGDNGDETNGVPGASPTPDWPASSPWVTAVGGTSLAVGASDNYLFETGWATQRQLLTNGAWAPATWLYGSGGGTSRLFGQPSYQAGGVPNAMATTYGGAAMRVVPDVSMDGDPNTGMLIGITQRFATGTSYGEYRIGGTSLSSPLMAGMLALAAQLKGSPLGFVNPALYAHAGSSAYRDVVPPASTLGVVRADYINGEDATGGYRYSLRLLNQDQVLTIHTAPGYDNVTGVGTPNGSAFLSAIGQ